MTEAEQTAKITAVQERIAQVLEEEGCYLDVQMVPQVVIRTKPEEEPQPAEQTEHTDSPTTPDAPTPDAQGLCMNKEWGKTRRSFGRMAVLEATTPHKGAPDGVYACPRCTCNA